MLSEEAKVILERYRATLAKLRAVAGEGGDVGDKLVRMMGLPSSELNQFGEDGVNLAEMLVDDLFPVRTIRGQVIRWDDEITTERLVACGFVANRRDEYVLGDLTAQPQRDTNGDRYFVWFAFGQFYPISIKNMGGVWRLTEDCDRAAQ